MSYCTGIRVWFATAICFVGFSAHSGEKKIIGHGWDLLAVQPANVVRNLDAWEQVPLDGISLGIEKQLPEGKKIGFKTIMTDPVWDRQWFVKDLVTLRECGSRNLTHNFLTTYWAPTQRLAWNDNEAWERFAQNIGVMAWVAKNGQAKGILLDSEDYTGAKQFFLVAGDASYEVTCALARQRGAQIMSSIASEYPDITLLSFWMMSLHANQLEADEPLAIMAAAGDLWPSFINGMLDTLPPSAQLVDGDEHAYRYHASNQDFYRAYSRTQNKGLKLVDPINRTKYQTQMSLGFGLYLDMYTNPSDAPWFFGEKYGSRLNHLQSNFAQALDVAQEYVWVYGEQMDWIKWAGTSRDQNPTWEERLPGFLSTVDRLRDPKGWAEKMLERQRLAGTLKNGVVNGSCIPENAETQEEDHSDWSPGCPTGWWSWQNETTRQGVFKTELQKGRGDDFSLCAVGVEEGCFMTSIQVSPGQEFVVEAYAQGETTGLTVRWKCAGAWVDESMRKPVFEFAAAGSDGWRRALGLVQVPEGADEIVLLLNFQQAENERTWFDDIGLYSVREGIAVPFSKPVSVNTFPCQDSRHWMTVRTNSVPLHWEWKANAASAQLKINGMNKSVVTNFSSVTTDWVWQISTSSVLSAEDEDVYTLTLTYRDNGGVVVGALTSQLAVVTGAFGQTPVDPSLTEKPAWRKVERNVVIPYDVRWDEAPVPATSSQLVIAKTDGLTQTHTLSNISGYFGWKIQPSNWGYGTFDLILTFPGTVANGWEATLIRMPTATVMDLR